MTDFEDDRAVAAVAAAVVRAATFEAGDVAAAALVDALGVSWAGIWQTDYVMRRLHPIGSSPIEGARRSLDIDTTAAGQVFRTQQAIVTVTGQVEVLIIPLTSRGHRVGVVQLGRRGAWTDSLQGRAVRCAELLAPLLWEAGRGEDVTEQRRRSTRLSLPAEMQ